MGNVEPLEIAWALMFTIAGGNFLTELRFSIRQFRRLMEVAKSGLIAPEVIASRRIEAWRNISSWVLLSVICFCMAEPGWYGMFIPPLQQTRQYDGWAVFSSFMIIVAAFLIFSWSCSLRYFSRKMSNNLQWRKRREDPEQSLAHLNRAGK